MSVFGTILSIVLIIVLGLFCFKNAKSLYLTIKAKREQKLKNNNENKEV